MVKIAGATKIWSIKDTLKLVGLKLRLDLGKVQKTCAECRQEKTVKWHEREKEQFICPDCTEKMFFKAYAEKEKTDPNWSDGYYFPTLEEEAEWEEREKLGIKTVVILGKKPKV